MTENNMGRYSPLNDDLGLESREPSTVDATLMDGKFSFEPRSKNASDEVICSQRQADHDAWVATIWFELKRQWELAGPMALANLLSFSIQVVAIMFVGHLGELQLAGASLANSIAGVTGFTFSVGLSSGLETLCGQAYGAKKYHLLGVYFQTAVIVLCAMCIPVALLWFHIEPLLIFIGQDPVVAQMAAKYMLWLLPCLASSVLLQPLLRFLQTQSIVLPTLVFAVVALFMHIPLCYLLIYKLGLGYIGAAVAVSTSWWLYTLMLITYILLSGVCSETWKGLTLEAFKGWKLYLKLAFPSAIMICLEFWCFEIVILSSGLLPNPQLELSLLSICLNTAALAYMIPYGLSGAASTRVSNELGAGHPAAAKLAMNVALGISLSQAVVVASSLFILRKVWLLAFTDVKEIVDHATALVPFVMASTILDGTQGVLSGVIRGCGWQHVGAYVNLASYYAVGFPLAIVFGFVLHLNARGLWAGLVCGLFVQAGSLLFITLRTNWQQMAEDAAKRVNSADDLVDPLLSLFSEGSEC